MWMSFPLGLKHTRSGEECLRNGQVSQVGLFQQLRLSKKPQQENPQKEAMIPCQTSNLSHDKSKTNIVTEVLVKRTHAQTTSSTSFSWREWPRIMLCPGCGQAEMGCSLSDTLQISTPALVRQHKVQSVCLGVSCSKSREKGDIKRLWQVVVNSPEDIFSIWVHRRSFYSSSAWCLFQSFYTDNHLFRTEFIHENPAAFSEKSELLVNFKKNCFKKLLYLRTLSSLLWVE